MSMMNEAGVRSNGSPLRTNYRRTNFMPVDQMDPRKKNSIINGRFVTGLIPAVVFVASILTFSLVRYLWAADELRRATISLDETRAISRYPLATREAVRDRAIDIKRSADALDQHENRVLTGVVPLVLLSNAMPVDVRIKTVSFDPGHAMVSQGEALNYNAIVAMSNLLQNQFPATVSTVNHGNLTGTAMDTQTHADAWGWTGSIALNPMSTDPNVRRPR